MALAIDTSTPAVAINSVSTTATVTTASFTPPAGALLLVRWAGNSTSGVSPSAPSITDSLGAHLTYTLVDWRSRADASAISGQAATWWAVVGSSAAMTVTVTSGTAPSSDRASALHVTVITGQHATPIGAHGKSGSSSASSIAQSYTAQATSGWGFIGVCDWDAVGTETAGSGCTLTNGGAGSVTGPQISYGFVRRSSADDANGVSNTLNVGLPGASTNLAWTYVEVVPAGAGGGSVNAAGSISPTGALHYEAQKRLAGTVAPTGALARQPGKLTAGTVTPVGGLVRSVRKTLTGAVTPAGAVATARVILRAMAGAITPAGALIRSTARSVAGTVTPTAVLLCRTAKSMTGSVTPAGALTSIRTRLLILLGSITPTGVVGRRPGKGLSGSVPPTGALTKHTSRSLTGSLTPGGAVAAAIGRMLTVAGAITPSGAITRAVGKVVAGTVAPAGTIRKLTAMAMAGAVVPAGAVLKLIARLLDGGITPAAVVDLELNPAPPPGEPPAARGVVELRSTGSVNVVNGPGVTLR